MSDMVADAMLTPGAPNAPAKNLHTVKAWMLWVKPAPRTNAAKIGVVIR